MSSSPSVAHAPGDGNSGSAHQYDRLFDAIGFYIDRSGGADVLVQEIVGGFLIVFRIADGQQVITLEPTDLDHIRAEIDDLERAAAAAQIDRKSPGHLRFTLRHARSATDSQVAPPDQVIAAESATLRMRLRCVGRYLDSRHATSVTVQEHGNGYEMEFTGQPLEDNLAPMVRLSERIDNTGLSVWSDLH